MKKTRLVWTLLGAFLLSSCGAPEGRELARSPGPPAIRSGAVERHARQLERTIGPRPAGSRAELFAASYILRELQTAGYLVRLDFVPLENLVRSSNVVALPRSGDEPRVVVTTSYDGRGGGAAVGALLELARALAVARPRHSVEFVALGAERTRVKGGRLGSRRLAKVLIDEGKTASVIFIASRAGGEAPFAARGDGAFALGASARRAGILAPAVTTAPGDRLFDAAGIHNVVVSGDPPAVARALLEYLSSAAD